MTKKKEKFIPTDEDRRIFQLWENAPSCLWPSKDFFSKDNYYKAHRAFEKGGHKAIGFDKKKVFDFCMETIEKRDAAEDIHVEQCVVVHDLIKSAGGKLIHYNEIRNSVLFMNLESSHLHYFKDTADYSIKLKRAAAGRGYWFSYDSVDLSKQIPAENNNECWAITRLPIEGVDNYPEIEKYLLQSIDLWSLSSNARMIAKLLPDLLLGRYDKSYSDYPSYKPTMLTMGGRSFFVTSGSKTDDKDIVSVDNAVFKREVLP